MEGVVCGNSRDEGLLFGEDNGLFESLLMPTTHRQRHSNLITHILHTICSLQCFMSEEDGGQT